MAIFEVIAGTSQWRTIRRRIATSAASSRARIPALRGETGVVLRARRQRAAFFDRGYHASSQDNLDQGGLVARISERVGKPYEQLTMGAFGMKWPG